MEDHKYECDDSSLEDDLDALDDLNVHYDFSAWDSFRKSLTIEKRDALRRSMPSLIVPFRQISDDEIESEVCSESPTPTNICDVASADSLADNGTDADDPTFDLTDEERYDNAAWRMRLTASSVFAWDYRPKRWEKKEMDAIAEFLELNNPNDHAEDEHGLGDSRNAINFIFFPQPGEFQSVLLKRGPVLLGGDERELMVFSRGFLFSRIELDKMFDLLFDVPSSNEVLPLEQLDERFGDIDVDGSGSLDRCEIEVFFRNMGMVLSAKSFDDLMKRLDSDNDGTISFDEVKSFMKKVKSEMDNDQSTRFFSVKTLASKWKSAISKIGITRKFDVAFQMADIERIESISLCRTQKTSVLVDDAGLERLTLAIYLKGVAVPLVVTCAKPGHVEAWMEVFRTCITNLKLPPFEEHKDSIDCSHAGLIVGADTSQNERLRSKRISIEKWRGGPIDWGFDD